MLNPCVLIYVEKVNPRGGKIKSNVEKPSWKSLSPGDAVNGAEVFPDDHHQTAGFPFGAAVDIGEVRVLPITAEPPPSVLEK